MFWFLTPSGCPRKTKIKGYVQYRWLQGFLADEETPIPDVMALELWHDTDQNPFLQLNRTQCYSGVDDEKRLLKAHNRERDYTSKAYLGTVF